MSLEMKKTLWFSLLLHICFFTAALLWSALLFEGSGEKQGEKVLFIRLLKAKRAGTGEQTVIRRTPVSMEAARALTDTKTPEQRRLLVRREKTLRISHDPKLPVADAPGMESDDPENTGFDTSEAAEPVSVDAGIVVRTLDGIDSAVNGGQDGDDSYNDTAARSGRYEVSDGTGITAGSVPADVMETIRNAIERFKTYPLAARRRGTEGVVHVSFSITPEGKPDQVRIVRSSGSHLLDRATIDTVMRASPYPYVNASLEVPVMYRLEE